jgi:hypothetical protein
VYRLPAAAAATRGFRAGRARTLVHAESYARRRDWDNRGHTNWLDEDVPKSIGPLGDKAHKFADPQKFSERFEKSRSGLPAEDTGDCVADKSTIFADGFAIRSMAPALGHRPG